MPDTDDRPQAGLDERSRLFAGSLRYALPSLEVKDHCSALLAWSDFDRPSADWMPAMDAHILICREGYAILETRAGETITLPSCAFVGPLSGATRLVASRDYVAEGIVLRPPGLKLATGRSNADQLVDQALALHELLPEDVLLPLLKVCSPQTCREDVWTALEELVQHVADTPLGEADRRFQVVDRWMRGSSNPSVSQLISDLGLSARQAGRVVSAAYGFTPKILSMRRRAHVAAMNVVIGAANDDTVYDAFYDQSHLIREFQRFIGSTPSELARGGTLAHHAIRAARQAGANLV